MTTDLVLRTLGTLTCIYMVGLFVSVMSVSALNAVSNSAGSPCMGAGCHIAYQDRAPASHPQMPETNIIHAAAMFVTEGF